MGVGKSPPKVVSGRVCTSGTYQWPLVAHQQRLVVGQQFGEQAQHRERQEQLQAAVAQAVALEPPPGPAARGSADAAAQSYFTRGSTHR